MEKRMPSSIRKYIRQEKSRIRREVLDLKKQKELIGDLYQELLKYKKKGDESLDSSSISIAQ